MASLTQLRYAVAVAHHHSFQRAAAACFVTQPTLSMQLKKLESGLGVVLFDRSRKPVAPTEDGARLLAQFRRVLSEVDRIGELCQELKGGLSGTFRLGILPTIAPTLLPRIVSRFRATYPAVQLRIEELTTDEITHRLLEETLHAGILATPLSDLRINEAPVGRESFVVFHAPTLSIPTTPQGEARVCDLPMDRLLLMREGHCLRAQILDLCTLPRTDTPQQVVLEAGSLATLTRVVMGGPYFTILPAMAAQELREQGLGGQLKPLQAPVPYREVSVVSHRTEIRRAIREALVATCTAVFSELSAVSLAAAPVPPR